MRMMRKSAYVLCLTAGGAALWAARAWSPGGFAWAAGGAWAHFAPRRPAQMPPGAYRVVAAARANGPCPRHTTAPRAVARPGETPPANAPPRPPPAAWCTRLTWEFRNDGAVPARLGAPQVAASTQLVGLEGACQSIAWVEAPDNLWADVVVAPGATSARLTTCYEGSCGPRRDVGWAIDAVPVGGLMLRPTADIVGTLLP